MIRLETDASFVLDPDYFVFRGLTTCEDSSRHYRSTKNVSPMVTALYKPDPKIDDIVTTILKSYGTAARLRLEKKGGGASEFLPNGEFHVLTPELKLKLSRIPATSDAIESFFGVLDLVSSEQSKNLSYHVQSGLATWRYNKTKNWLLSLTDVQRNRLSKDARREGKRDKRKTDKCIEEADNETMNRMEVDRKLERRKMKTKCRSLLDNADVKVFRSRTEFNEVIKGLDKFGNKVRRMIQLQIRLLVQRGLQPEEGTVNVFQFEGHGKF